MHRLHTGALVNLVLLTYLQSGSKRVICRNGVRSHEGHIEKWGEGQIMVRRRCGVQALVTPSISRLHRWPAPICANRLICRWFHHLYRQYRTPLPHKILRTFRPSSGVYCNTMCVLFYWRNWRVFNESVPEWSDVHRHGDLQNLHMYAGVLRVTMRDGWVLSTLCCYRQSWPTTVTSQCRIIGTI